MQNLHAGADVACLAFAKPARVYDCLDLVDIGCCKRSNVREAGVQILHYDIYAGIRALCSKSYGDEQLPRFIVGERAARIRVCLFQAFDHFKR